MTDQTADTTTRTLLMPRKRNIGFLVIGVVFVAAGIINLHDNPAIAWATIVFFGLGTVVSAIQLIRPPALILDAAGFEQRQPFRRDPGRRLWRDCSEFSPLQGTLKLVVYSTNRHDLGALRDTNRALVGHDEAVRSGFGGLDATQLASLMNEYRKASLAG